MAAPRSFKQINTASRDLQLIQANIERAIAGAINAQLLNGRLMTDIALVSGNTNIEHKLSRTPVGYLVVDKNNSATIYTAAKTEDFLTLNSSAACVVSLWIF